MQPSSTRDVASWLRGLATLFRQRMCDGPEFLRPFHFVMLALEAKRHGARRLTLPNNLQQYAARMSLWGAVGLDPPCDVGRRNPAGRFLPVQPLHNQDTVAALRDYPQRGWSPSRGA